MKIMHALLVAAGLAIAQTGYAGETIKAITVGTGTQSWQLFIVNNAGTGNVDAIELANYNWTENYLMSQGNVSPSMFSLTYNTLKEAFTRSDVLNLQVSYEGNDPAAGRRLYRAILTHK